MQTGWIAVFMNLALFDLHKEGKVLSVLKESDWEYEVISVEEKRR